jgi:hypothetical protein
MKKILIIVLAVSLLIAGCGGGNSEDISVICNPESVSVGGIVNCDVITNVNLNEVRVLQFDLAPLSYLGLKGLTEDLRLVFNPSTGIGALSSVQGFNFNAGEILFTINLDAKQSGGEVVSFTSFRLKSGATVDIPVVVGQSNVVVVS